MKASEVVHDATVCELEDAFKGKDYSSKFKMLKDGEDVTDDEIAQDPIVQEFKSEGVTLRTGDVFRLGRVCFMVKESSIEKTQNTVKLLEQYAISKNKAKMEQIIQNSSDGGHSPQTALAQRGSSVPPKRRRSQLKNVESSVAEGSSGTRFYDAVGDYFDNQLAVRN